MRNESKGARVSGPAAVFNCAERCEVVPPPHALPLRSHAFSLNSSLVARSINWQLKSVWRLPQTNYRQLIAKNMRTPQGLLHSYFIEMNWGLYACVCERVFVCKTTANLNQFMFVLCGAFIHVKLETCQLRRQRCKYRIDTDLDWPSNRCKADWHMEKFFNFLFTFSQSSINLRWSEIVPQTWPSFQIKWKLIIDIAKED